RRCCTWCGKRISLPSRFIRVPRSCPRGICRRSRPAARFWFGPSARFDRPLAQESKASDLEVLVEGECVLEPKLAHELEAHRIGERERLIGEPSEPAVDRASNEGAGGCAPVVLWIAREPANSLMRLLRPAQKKEVRVELGEDQERADVSAAGGMMRASDFDRASVVLVARMRQGEQRARINECAHACD